MHNILIREAMPEDAEAILACMKQVGSETDNLTFGAEGLPLTVEQERAFLQEQLESDRAVFLCAWDGDRLVGTANLHALSRRMGHRAELGISVIQAYWGRGIAGRMLEQLIACAKAHGMELLNLEVRSDNARAIRLYEKLGFQATGAFPAFFKIGDRYADCIAMCLDLRSAVGNVVKAPRITTPCAIGVFSSSSPISATVPVRYDRGVAYLESQGFTVVHGRQYRKQDHYRSGSIRERAEEFNQLLYREDIPILMASIGGNNTNSILPYIDYDYLKAHPKIIIGYSDVTALLLAIYAKTGLVTFYGPAAAASFGELPPFVDETFAAFYQMVSGKLPVPHTFAMPPFWTDEFLDWSTQDRAKEQRPNAWRCVHPGVAEGRLIGGNLNTMEGFFGTEYMPEIRPGDILLLEDSLKDASTIERSFSLLKLSGVLDKVGGILLGKHEKFDDSGTGRRPYEILLEVLGEPKIPILADFDCCHTHPMLTMPIGCRIRLDAVNGKVTLLESPLL